MDLFGLALGVAWLTARLLPPQGRRTRGHDVGLLLLTVVLVELAAVRLGGLLQYAPDALASPAGLSVGAVALRFMLVGEVVGIGIGDAGRSAPRSALLAFVDTALLEVVGTGLGLWRWTEPGALGFSLVAPLGWAACAMALAWVLPRRRALAPAVALCTTVLVVTAAWWCLLRWLPFPSRLAMSVARLAPWSALPAALLLLLQLAWSVRVAVRARRGAAGEAGVANDGSRGVALAGFALALAAIVGLLLISPPAPKEVTADEVLAADERSVVLVGDIMLARGVAQLVKERGGFDRFFAATRPMLSAADITFGNLESVVASSGTKKERGIAFRAPPRAAPALAQAGFDVVSAANNHAADFGYEAMVESQGLLLAAGVQPVGVGPADQPQAPVIVERDGHRFGFLAYCDPHAPRGCTHWDRKMPMRVHRATDLALRRDIPALRAQVDTLIVSLHWGVESQREPDAWQAALGRRIIDLGADIVAGHHAHTHQRAERYRGGVILYSMGNFVFDQRSHPKFMESGLYRVVVAKDGVRRASVLPVRYRAKEYVPTPVAEGSLEIGDRTRLR